MDSPQSRVRNKEKDPAQNEETLEGNRRRSGASQDGPGASLLVQWLQLHTSNARGLGSIPGWGTRFPHATAKTLAQPNK